MRQHLELLSDSNGLTIGLDTPIQVAHKLIQLGLG